MNSVRANSQPEARFPHACEKLAAVIAHEGSPIKYLAEFREYILESEDEDHPIEWCPFCGTLLPLSLRETHSAWLREAESKSNVEMLGKLETDEWRRRVIRDGEVDITDRPTFLTWFGPTIERE